MKKKLIFGTGLAAGYVLGSRSGRAAYEKLKARASGLWQSKPVQDKVAAATEAVKEKAPEVSSQLTEAARRAGTVISSAVRHDGDQAASASATPSGAGVSAGAASDAGAPAEGAIPAHSTHPGTPNLAHTNPDAAPDAEPGKN